MYQTTSEGSTYKLSLNIVYIDAYISWTSCMYPDDITILSNLLIKLQCRVLGGVSLEVLLAWLLSLEFVGKDWRQK
jgi:hypothetical protein